MTKLELASSLESYVGKIYHIDFRDIKIENIFYFYEKFYYLCRWTDTDEVFTASPVEVLINFDNKNKPIKDY